jgi:hypothetical protein
MAEDPEVDADELEVENPVDDAEPDTDDEPEGESEDEPAEDTEASAADDGEQPVPARSQERQPTGRAERRITAQQEELRKRDQQIADLNRRLDGMLQTSQRNRQPAETPEQRETRLALLDPVERMRVEMQESQQVSQRQMAQMAFTFQDSSDKATFDAKALVDPLYGKWGPKVEEALRNLRDKGQNVSREQMLKYLIGEAALAGRKSQTGQQRKAAAGRMARNRTSPSNSRSDAQGERRGGSDANALEKRLENLQI